jgi:YHS domain-containing protein
MAALAFVGVQAVRAEDAPKTDKHPEAKPAAAAVKCIMMDEPIDPSTRTVTDSGVVYFCCSDCIKKYKADPAKYADKAAAQQKLTADMPHVQVGCPLCGEPASTQVYLKQESGKLYFCCEKCMAKYNEAPAEHAKTLKSIYSVQGTCPICTKPIEPKYHVDFTTDQRIYFCCKECAEKFKADPAAAKDKLSKMNIFVDPKTMKGA